MRNMTIYVTLVLLCTIVFTGQSADIPQKDEPSLRDLLGVDIPQQPAPEKQKPKFVVEVLIQCDDENTKAFIESHIKRELRSLQDVEIADFGTYRLEIVALEPENASEVKLGLTFFASLFVRRYDPSTVWSKLMDEYPLDTKEYKELRDSGTILDLLSLYDKTYLAVSGAGRKKLDEICKVIVVNFDTEMLEPDRNGK